MALKVLLSSGDFSMKATLNDTAAAQVAASKLPVEGLAQTRGAEVYFFVDFSIEAQDPTEEAPPGTIAYWPAGSAVSIVYGSRPITPVEVIGQLDGDPTEWRKVISGSTISMRKA